MADTGRDRADGQWARKKDRIIAPVAADMRKVGWLVVLGGAIWPAQAACIAWAPRQAPTRPSTGPTR
ncbi:hypothetical protein [Sediminimonas qiaohouensis]|uniref:hypothetical protein n=1 Tax=Sediminimonas qiaohouensis TaxID=552061 RepID=UPI0003F7EF33|nr:hypothetical protein [Sediminimonas qiaohouensis]